jgi:DNA-binding CsgD family transcriptional regulator
MSNHKANYSWVPRAIRLYEQGMSLRQVGQHIGVKPHTVYYHLRQRAVQFRPAGFHHGVRPNHHTSWVNYAERLYRQGMTVAEVAEAVGKRPDTVWRHLRRRKVPMRQRGPRKATWSNEAIRMWCRGYPLGEIATSLDKPRDQVRHRLWQAGIRVGTTPDWVRTAVGLYTRGYTAAEIAMCVDRQPQTVRRQLRRAGAWHNSQR